MASNRIDKCLHKLGEQQRKAFIPYIMGGDPDFDTSLQVMHSLVDAGADILEVGFAFSDPAADGPVIQLAHERVIKSGMNLQLTFELIGKFRQQDANTPIVLMGYLNPVLRMGYEKFVQQLIASGIDGVLIVDLPAQDSSHLHSLLEQNDILNIHFLTPTTSQQRIEEIVAIAKGYIYYISVKGITGAANLETHAVKVQLDKIKGYTDLPIAVGFGIKDEASVRALKGCGQAIIVGTALVDIIAQHQDDREQLISNLKGITTRLTQALN